MRPDQCDCKMWERVPWKKFGWRCVGCHRIVDCKTCEDIEHNGGFGPNHNAMPTCRSGRHPHCTCDTCF